MDAAAPAAGRDWSELPLNALSLIFTKLGAVDVLMGAGLVCGPWLDAAKVPDVWRSVDMENHEVVVEKDRDVLRAMARVAVDRSNGKLEVFAGKRFVNDELLEYIFERSPSLTSLRLVSCYGIFGKRFIHRYCDGLRELRYLQLDDINIFVEELTDVLENCPLLELLQVRKCFYFIDQDYVDALVAKYAGSSLTFDWDQDFGDYYGSFDSDDD